jgi:hypothetical protein
VLFLQDILNESLGSNKMSHINSGQSTVARALFSKCKESKFQYERTKRKK